MRITSFGAAEEVTGSRHLLEINSYRILLDCGMFQGHREEADAKNRHLGFAADSIHAVILSHAHIDHSGLLPMLAKYGYRGTIFCTPATRDLCAIMLMDSAHIQKRDAEWLSKKHMQFIPPLYHEEDVQEIMRRFVSIPYGVRLPLVPEVYVTFHDAGHVLGSAMVEIEYIEKDKRRTFVFSGDIGRKNTSILCDPWEPTNADVVLMESTYGNREHGPVSQMDEHLAQVINETYARKGKILIPSFALERAQEIIYSLKKLKARQAIPDIPVFVDSPLTVNVTEVFRLHTEAFDEEFRKVMRDTGDPFQMTNIKYIRSSEESKELNKLEGSAIIIAAAGMCEYGRILHHIKNHCEDPTTTILIVGFQAKHTLGRRIVERRRTIRVFGVIKELNARVHIMNEFSAHAGRSELLEFARRFMGRAEKILLVHGEREAQLALVDTLKKEGLDVQVQKLGAPVEV